MKQPYYDEEAEYMDGPGARDRIPDTDRDGKGVSATQAKPGRVEVEVELLAKEIELADDQLAALEERLSSVLSPDYDAEAESVSLDTVTSASSALVASLMLQRKRIIAIGKRLELLVQRIEV